jgi:hypothetical protein
MQPDDKAQQKLAYNIDKLTTWSHAKALLDKAQYTYWCKNGPRVYGEDLSLFLKGESIDTNWTMIDQSSSFRLRYQDHRDHTLKYLSILSFGTDLTRGGMTIRNHLRWTTSTVESGGGGGIRINFLGYGLIFVQ